MELANRVRRLRQALGNGRGLRRWSLRLLRAAAAAVLMGVALRNVDLHSQIARWRAVDALHMVAVCLLIIAGQAVSAVRWRLLARPLSISLSVRQAFKLNMVGMFFNLAFPTSIGGDALKALLLVRHTGRSVESVMTVLMARLLGFAALLLIGLTAGFLFGSALLPRRTLATVAVVAGLLATGVGLLVRSSQASRWLGSGAGMVARTVRRAVMAGQLLARNPVPLARALALSVVIQFLSIHAYYEASRAIGVRGPYADFLVFIPLIIMATMIPISIAGLGLRENAFVLLFQHSGIDPSSSVSISLTWFFAYVLVSACGIIFLLGLEESFFAGGDAVRAPAEATSQEPAPGKDPPV